MSRRSARLLPLAAAAFAAAGCAGHVADYVGAREGIVAPQVGRFGLDLRQTQCVSNQLTQALNPRQLRYLNRALRDVRRGYYDPDRLTVRDLIRAGETGLYEKLITRVDRVVLAEVLRQVRGNQVRASELLGIARNTLRSKLRAAGLAVEKQVGFDPDQDGQ